MLAIVVAAICLTTSCAHRAQMSREQRRECRRMRTKAALAGVGVTVGMAVVATAIVVVAVATRGNVGSGSGGGGSRRRARRQERRRLRHQVCYEQLQSTPHDSAATSGGAVAQVSTTDAPPSLARQANGPPPAATASVAGRATAGQPPSEEVLAATFEQIEPKVRDCLGVGPVAQISVAIDGPSGRVSGYAVHGMSPDATQNQCLVRQLQRMRFAPFYDEMRVRFAIDLSWVPPPGGATAPSTAP